MNTKKWGYISARPTDYVVHSRRGKIRQQGMGLSFFCLPVIDRYCVLSTLCNSITFAADQITRENQGVEITGFAVWKIAHGDATNKRFDFDGARDPLEVIGCYLKDVVESAIRHRIANMTIEDVLRKRATMIIELKKELSYITCQWGLELDTIEIKNVKILSGSVFAHLQARYRDSLKLDAETSALDTEKVIEERRLKQQRDIAEQEHACQLREAELKKALELLAQNNRLETEGKRLAIDHELRLKTGAQELARAESLCAGRIRIQSAERAALTAEGETLRVRQQTEQETAEHKSKLAQIDIEDARKRIAVDNGANPALAMIRLLPQTAQALKINELNLGDNTIMQAIRQIGRTFAMTRASTAAAPAKP